MDEQDEQRLRAELRLHRARQHLYEVQRATMLGHVHEAPVREALATYRQAQADCLRVRHATSDPATPPPGAVPATPRLRFVRWLVATGRLNEDEGPPGS